MTSTAGGAHGPRYGFLRYDVIEQGILPAEKRKGMLPEHIRVFGGEEWFWMGPEGGQFAIFFKPGSKFEFGDWLTPAAIKTGTPTRWCDVTRARRPSAATAR